MNYPNELIRLFCEASLFGKLTLLATIVSATLLIIYWVCYVMFLFNNKK